MTDLEMYSKNNVSTLINMDPAVEDGGDLTIEINDAAKVKERLQKRHQARLEDAERRNASAPPTREQCGISNLSNEFVTKTSEEISKQVVLLTHLTHCKVRLFGSPSTVHLKHIEDCEILCGPVASSVLIDHCTNSTLAFPCQQLRIHNTTNTQVYVHVTSRAIVENCSRVGFAPFTWSYPRLEEDFSLSGLDKDRNNWNLVDDCNWLETGTPSPNWTVITEGERKNNFPKGGIFHL
uniref:Tubulin folding cofactor C n=2 Tax=Gouania willdenowi TaxID=441366 RepID=A0A8C5DSN1_GOUWI